MAGAYLLPLILALAALVVVLALARLAADWFSNR
jgi:hypothetical protein